MMGSLKEQRQHKRFDTDVKIYFDFAYDVETKVKFQVVKNSHPSPATQRYPGVSRNISIEGLCFVSSKQLSMGDKLNVEVFLPGSKDPIHMQGEVRWCHPLANSNKDEPAFESGLKVLTVEDQSVEKSIYFDEEYHVYWSTVLDSVLGTYRIIASKNKDRS